MAFPPSFLSELKSRCDIETIISTYVRLKRAGANSVGNCPFHSEKTPSFTVFRNTQNFYCFGCGAGGDVITFVMRMENLDYLSAVEKLCNMAGMAMPENTYAGTAKKVDRKRIFELNKKAARYFYDALLKPENAHALKYITDRGLTPRTIKHFGIGYADTSFDSLSGYLKSQGYSDEELKEAFLCGINKYNKPFDMFRGRIMFPIIDVSGEVVAFGGRIIGDGMPKYLNSSDTPVFNKRRNLYALNYAKATTDSSLILCEGYMDVVALHQAGFYNAVATLGTAITPEQARVMARYANKIYICYDSDAAGRKATDKAIALLSEAGLSVKVITVKNAKDPDEYIKKFGKASFSSLINGSEGRIEFKFRTLMGNYNLDVPEEKLDFVNKSCEMLCDVYSPVELDVFLMKLSELTGVDITILRNEVNKRRKKREKDENRKEIEQQIQKSMGYGDKINPDRQKFTACASIEENIIGILMLRSDFIKDEEIQKNLNADMFMCEFNRQVFQRLSQIAAESDSNEIDIGQLGQYFNPEQMGAIMRMQVNRSGYSNNSPEVLNELIQRLADQNLKNNATETDLMDYLQKLKEKKK
ncbi:MAG: DNA primase [Clostridia bacterium]|nr:DNA primase [Clostridia bacterium]